MLQTRWGARGWGAPWTTRRTCNLTTRVERRLPPLHAADQNEEEVGDALDHVLRNGLVPRRELYICSKVWWVPPAVVLGHQSFWVTKRSEQY